MEKEKRNLWEMYTPYGVYTILGSFQEVTIVSIMLGQGEYKLKEAFGIKEVPILSGSNYDNWALENFNMSLDDLIKNMNKIKISEVLESVIKANKYERLNYEEHMNLIISTEDKKEYKEKWNNENDSGIHGITEQAWRLANYLIPKNKLNEIVN